MAFTQAFDFSRPTQLTIDRKPVNIFEDIDTLDSLDNDMISPSSDSAAAARRDSNAPIFSPQTNPWDDFGTGMSDRQFSTATTTSAFPEQHSNNPFMRSNSTPFAPHHHHQASWPMFDAPDPARTPSTPTPFTHVPATPFGGLPVSTAVRPSSVFPAAGGVSTPMPQSPAAAGKEWMSLAEQSMERTSLPKRMRAGSPQRPFSPFQRRDGIRKKNARFEIPPERSLLNIDQLISQSNNDEEIKELKQQKRLLRNRQAALDSRQRKKKHTEQLEEEKKEWNDRLNMLQEELGKMQVQNENLNQEKEHLLRETIQYQQTVESLTWEKENLVRDHTLETGELRRKISVLTDRLESASNIMPQQPATSYNGFDYGLNNLNMDSDWDEMFNDMAEMEDAPHTHAHGKETTLVVAPKKKEVFVGDDDKPVASGLLMLLLLCGAFVASKSSGSSAPAIPRMSDEVRAASAVVLDTVFKDAGVGPQPGMLHAAHAMNAFEPAPSGTHWPKRTQPGADMAMGGAASSGSSLDMLSSRLTAVSKEAEAEQIFSLSANQYNSLTEQYTRRTYSGSASDDEGGSPASASSNRRNLAETLKAMRDEAKGESAAEVYTRSLLWDRIPTEVVRDFKRMIEESASARGD
ncbi:hypothetical protein EJ06DRAFT_536277 [Trichodelitschia bisporula]|uniref:BZIP domain-containing protein n=1 Tax=Trichodelitschia bisporula TaxID=703511 RepID=A0A6G1I7G3_9PEZI|nr:hypothetical protein EJ06DRAFT_536277 [Trichodelitschia bisporula]